MKYRILFFLVLIFINQSIRAQTIQLLYTDSSKISFRGLSVVNDKVVWVSGSKGKVGLSVNGGLQWKWINVKGHEKRDFRDIEAFDENTAIIMAVGEPAVILKTNNAGKDWKLVFEDNRNGMFLDAMEFWNEQSGIIVGDPIDGKIFIARTFDGGNNWRGLPEANYPVADSGEALFAASGTNIRKLNNQEAVFITGGKRSRLFIKDSKIDLPILQGEESTGANSIAVYDDKNFIIVGGNFSKDTLREKNCVLTNDKGKTFKMPLTPPFGYRSCVEYISKLRIISCGTSGVDLSNDGGMNWKNISKQGFHVCRKAKKGKKVFLAGVNTIAVLKD